MSVFGDWAGKYFDLGINVVPIDSNKTPPKGFTYKKWGEEKQTEEDIERMISEYGHKPGIAIICGAISGIVGFDFDYKYNEDKMPKDITFKKYQKDFTSIEDQLKRHLPEWVLAKKAKHGWTSFYKYSPDHVTIPCERYGVRLFDFKASGYVVIPPSHHSFQEGKDVFYSWICGDPMDDFLNLPSLDIGIINDFREVFAHRKPGGSIGGRHGEIFKFACDLIKIEDDDALIAKKMIQYDSFKNGAENKGPYFKDKSMVSGDPMKYALSWAARIRTFLDLKPIKEKKPGGKTAWNHFLETSIGEVRKDVLSKSLFYRKDKRSDWAHVDSVEKVLKSYAKDKGLNKNDVPDEVARYCFEKGEETFLCDLPKWDGVDRLMQIAECVKSPLFNAEEIRDILLHWGSGVFSRISSLGTAQNRCLILKGDQGLGKDFLVREILKDFKPYYEIISPPDNKKDWFEIVSRLYVAHIEEFDQTKNTSVALFKSILTQESVFFRESYGRAPEKSRTSLSFISTVNPDNFFRDQTGNRRYIVLPIDAILRKYPTNCSGQIIAQFRNQFDKSGQLDLSSKVEERIKNYVDALTPDRTDLEIEQLWVSRSSTLVAENMKFNYSSNGEAKLLDQETAAPIIYDIARMTDTRQKTVRSILKTKGYQRIMHGVRKWASQPKNLYSRDESGLIN
jgi:hypothetical protein